VNCNNGAPVPYILADTDLLLWESPNDIKTTIMIYIKKLLVLNAVLLLQTLCLHAQTLDITQVVPTDGVVEYYGVKYPCMVAEYPAPPEVVKNAFTERMNSMGFNKYETRKGFLVYRNVVLPNVHGDQKVDAFLLIESKSKKEKDKSIVHLITAEPGKIPDGKPDKDANTAAGVVAATGTAAFLSSSQSHVNDKEFARQTGLLELAIASQEKELKALKSDYDGLKKKLEKTQKDMEDNLKEQENATKKLEADRKQLEERKSGKPAEKKND
jgi:hypothetical protein